VFGDVSFLLDQPHSAAHRALGPGLLEASYEECFAREMQLSELGFERQVPLPVAYEGGKPDSPRQAVCGCARTRRRAASAAGAWRQAPHRTTSKGCCQACPG